MAATALALLLFIASNILAGPPILGGTLPSPLPLFPADNWWNLDISSAPVDPGSSSYISFINSGSTKRLHPDFGGDAAPGSVEIYGFPFIVVDGSQPKKAVRFAYAAESDGVDPVTGQGTPFYPIPDEAATQPHWIEGGQPGNIDLRSQSDRHMLIVDRDNRFLYELYNVYFDGTRWHAGSGAFFDMKTNNRRPDGWTSADAAGLAILPGLVRYDEVYGVDEIRHAFRVTVRATNGYVYPASHRAGSNSLALPMGARLRLKAGFDISGFRPEIQKIFRTMKKYGLIVADNGSDMYVSGTYDTRWNNDILNPALRAVTASDFEVVQLGYQPSQTICFPQLAVGGGYTTIFSLANTGAATATGNLYLYDKFGQPLGAALNEGSLPAYLRLGTLPHSAASPFSLALAPGATTFITAGPPDPSSPATTGWARLESLGGTVSGVATFQLREGNILRTIAGVFSSKPVGSATIPIDNDDREERFTGFAIANPDNEEIRIGLVTIAADGTQRDEIRPPALNPLPPRAQAAAYLHEYLSATRRFRGSLRLSADGNRKFVVVALQQLRGLYTAIPVIQGK